ncbi:hypothetical protein [Methylocystis heyeri]|uniref:ParB/Sulfiredoxin domain-containing protein n=1 Tax=Methylocystis heyeri TaxID=391905 RepID=A0A6B8KEU3_9HYPH|nr:hypothetical protein [Methylocystis heyeri]QGM46142.1 hypothetical protein H2LOC_010790 [Methylocystis heyeri]
MHQLFRSMCAERFAFTLHDGREIIFDISKLNDDIARNAVPAERSIANVDKSLADEWPEGPINPSRLELITRKIVADHPIACMALPNGAFILDGYHRYSRAVLSGMPEIKMRVITPEVAKQYVLSGVEYFDEFAKG